MSEATANALVAGLGVEDTKPADTDPIVDDEDVQEEDVDTTEEESTEEESDDTEEQEELPDAVKDILKKNRKELREANARAVAAEKALAAAKEGKEEAAPSEADSKFKELYLKSAAKTALVEAGITTGTDRFVKMLDLSSVEIDESGAISGLEDQIADLKEDFADVFKPKRKTVGNTDGARKAAPAVPKSSSDRLAALL
jgi:hypothetical protein